MTRLLASPDTDKKILAMGNEAVARGALEAGLGYFSTYPGTPASEVGEVLIALKEEFPNLYAEYSMNEHVAVHGALGASWSGVRAMAAMKHVGMNVAAEPLHFAGYTGIAAGMVVVIGSDPGATCSTSEQDDRWYSLHTHLPLLEPASIQEAKDFTRAAFEFSERFNMPFILNAPTRLCHNIGTLKLGALPPARSERGRFRPNKARYNNLFAGAVENHRKFLIALEEIKQRVAELRFNRVIPGAGEIGVISSSVNYLFVMEALKLLELKDIPVLKIGMSYPLAAAEIGAFLRPLKRAYIFEDLEGFLEFQIKALAYDLDLRIPIIGKKLTPSVGELSPDLIMDILCSELKRTRPAKLQIDKERVAALTQDLPPRQGAFCIGCPHRASVYALLKATGRRAVFAGDIGCYTLTCLAPYRAFDWVTCMNCGLATGQAVNLVAEKNSDPVVAYVGDSTLFHSGLPAVVNAVMNKSSALLLVLDNHWVAMTGHQPTPTTEEDLRGGKLPAVDLRTMFRALGVKYVRQVNPYRVQDTIAAIKSALGEPGLRVIILRAECALQQDRRSRMHHPAASEEYFALEPSRCERCHACYRDFGCPAIREAVEDGEPYYYIEPSVCIKCGACKDICPNSAIHRVEIKRKKAAVNN